MEISIRRLATILLDVISSYLSPTDSETSTRVADVEAQVDMVADSVARWVAAHADNPITK
jgi:hypothetical protein